MFLHRSFAVSQSLHRNIHIWGGKKTPTLSKMINLKKSSYATENGTFLLEVDAGLQLVAVPIVEG